MMALNYCIQPRAYPQDPETSFTCLRVEHRKRNWEKTLLLTLGVPKTVRNVFISIPWKRPTERPRPLKAKLGKTPD